MPMSNFEFLFKSEIWEKANLTPEILLKHYSQVRECSLDYPILITMRGEAVKDVYDDRKREVTAKHLFRNLKPLPDAWKLIDWALNSGIHTEILTAAGTVNRSLVCKDKIEWVREHCTDKWIIIPTFKGSQKAAFAHKKAVLIDDRQRNIDCWVKAGGIGILHTTADETIKQLNELIE